MNRESQLIEALADRLEPVRPMTRSLGIALVIVAFAVTLAGVALLAGLRSDLLSGHMPPIFVITNGLLLLVGISSALAVISMASPRVGASHDSPKWAMGGLALLPLSAFLAWLSPLTGSSALYRGMLDLHCVIEGGASAALVAAALLVWLRRGAPVSPQLSSLYLGVAAGALGMAAYGLACPLDSLAHLGIWHVLPVAALGLLGRLFVPAMIRW